MIAFKYPAVEKIWTDAANTLGFDDPGQMLTELYVGKKMSTNQLAKLLGWHATGIGDKLRELGIIRPKGGSPKGWKKGGIKRTYQMEE